MSEQEVNQRKPTSAGNARINFKSGYFVSLLTGVMSLGLVALLWLNNPSYTILVQNIDSATLVRVSAELQKNKIAYQYDSPTGNILVPEQKLYQARFALASGGLAQGALPEIPASDTNNPLAGFNTGNVDDGDLPQRYFALESELAKTIASIDNIHWARVHLSIVDSDATTNRKDSGASVVVRLAQGRGLSERKLASISQLIAASVANLSADNVTIIDQSGDLLKSSGNNLDESNSSMHYGYARKVEQTFIEKIESILVPIFGEKAIRVRVDADIELKKIDPVVDKIQQKGEKHIIKKLSATVVLDNKWVNNKSGETVSVPRTREELDKLERLVKEAIGFDQKRGDSVNVFNEVFGGLLSPVNQRQPLEKNSLYYLKIFLLALIGILVAYYVLRLVIHKIMEMKPVQLVPDAGEDSMANTATAGRRLSARSNPINRRVEGSNFGSYYESLLSDTRKLVNDNPEHVAKILKTWVKDNGR